ncbi:MULTISPECIES: isochorismatase family protein [Francisella]|uniref:Isochorismatase n=1 Tax=Francisella opportunistica TaxID=2016517 RepID=A0A345JRS3_9GAMM|nr:MULTISPECIES: isochorismatase family protein [Francisella]APC91765.1 Isochorismatase hydrolase family protein [Francisella sp. MA067296]AXH30019.1 isochorismatase [Francisella opportunistica]AXH31663.1 isochorismatase [Francisella opportunistica]AXH33309.1 isochorismatase [Francisella opportunistica]
MSKLLIVIDMQKGFECPQAKNIVEKFNKASELFDNVCFAMFENTKNSLFERQLKWFGFQNEADKALIDGIQVPQKASFVWHSTYTVYNQKLKQLIQKIQPTELYLCGLFSEVCLLKTTMDMFDDGMLAYVVKDLSASPRGDGVSDVAFATMKMAIGADRIISTREIS